MVVAPRPPQIALACTGSTFSSKIELSPAFWQGVQIGRFVVVTLGAPLSRLENRHLVTYIPHKLTLSMHFLRENEGSQKINAYSTTLLLIRFHLTRKKTRVFKHRL